MKLTAFLFVFVGLFACSENDPEPKVATANPPEVIEEGAGCDATIETNNHKAGILITVKAELSGCVSNVVLMSETRSASGSTLSLYRKPSECNETSQAVAFAAKGETVYLGLFPCGSPQASGRAYTLTVTQGIEVTTINAKVGNTIKYVVK